MRRHSCHGNQRRYCSGKFINHLPSFNHTSPFLFFLFPHRNCFNSAEILWCHLLTNVQAGGPSYAVELGRLDGLQSTAASVNGKLPKGSFNLNQLNSIFAANGLTQTDMIALSGNGKTRHVASHFCFVKHLLNFRGQLDVRYVLGNPLTASYCFVPLELRFVKNTFPKQNLISDYIVRVHYN